jgi:KRAB domain-containing zinc finger protein
LRRKFDLISCTGTGSFIPHLASLIIVHIISSLVDQNGFTNIFIIVSHLIPIKNRSTYFLQEGAILPEIVSRLTAVYGTGHIDIVAVSLFLQDLNDKPTVSLEYDMSDCKAKLTRSDDDTNDHIYANGKDYHADDIAHSEEETIIANNEADSKKKEYRSRRKVVCSHCNKVTVNKYTLDTHITACHPAACHSCSLCGKVYGLAELLTKHVRLKHDTTPRVEIKEEAAAGGKESGSRTAKLGWKCPDCDKVFRSRKSQELHSFRHVARGQKLFECDVCGKKLRNPVTLDKHVETFHKQLTEQLECGQCNMRFSLRTEWKEHMRSHGRPLCRICKTSFSSDAELKLHTASCSSKTAMSSTGVRCEYCGKTYSSEGVLKNHIRRVHLKEQDFVCDKCEQKFATKDELRKHMAAKHELDRQSFVCDACGKAYSSVSKLKNHIAYEHQNKEKPFACDICQSRFAYQPEMLRHRERHATVPQYSCPSCDKKFMTKNDMMRHKKVVHENYHVGSCEICGRYVYG